MRIAFTNWSNRIVGGAEHYLESAAQALHIRGHQVALWHEQNQPDDRRVLQLDGPSWDASKLGKEKSLEALRDWEPDVLYCQGFADPELHAATLTAGPGVFFAHNYHGTCISGGKTNYFPVVQPCERKFGAACLVNYYPRRCGGLNPMTMLRDYRLNQDRQAVLRRYHYLLTHSGSVQRDYLRSGLECGKVDFSADHAEHMPLPEDRWRGPGTSVRLLFLSRMVTNKGGHVLLESLPQVVEQLGKQVEVVMAGDGPKRLRLEALAREVMGHCPQVQVRFPGWVTARQKEAIFEHTDLLVVPSLWPEPYGLGGLEAGRHGVPTAAFAVGGIPDWLAEGKAGHMAPGNPPTALGLAEAIVRCLRDPVHYRKLRLGARQAAREQTMEKHYRAILPYFENAITQMGPQLREARA